MPNPRSVSIARPASVSTTTTMLSPLLPTHTRLPSGLIARAVVADDGPFTVVRRRDFVRCFTGGQRPEHLSGGAVDDGGGVVAHVAGDNRSVRRLLGGDAECGRNCCDPQRFHAASVERHRNTFNARIER